ncbi:hypothetical protein [Streptomyces sp. NPDC001492]
MRVLPADTRIPIFCQTTGTTVSGYYGTSNIRDTIDSSAYVPTPTSTPAPTAT